MHFIGGVIAHAQGLQALLGPTVNAYKRILPDSLAPTHANWGHDNRTAFCRVPNERGSRARVEIRTGDGSACPHLIVAALLLAGIDGIERGLDPGAPADYDLFEDAGHDVPQVPGSLAEALDALEADHEFLLRGGVFTEDLIRTWIDWKREHEVDVVRLRPHPAEFGLYYDC